MAKINIEKTVQNVAQKVIQELRNKGVFLGRWIPVSERLPENTQPVLMTIQRMDESYNHEPFISIGYISWNQSSWWCAHDGDCKSHNVRVTAWTPLPEPYKTESEDKE